MIGTSSLEYVWVVTWVIVLHSIGPLCAIYCATATFLPKYLRAWRYLEYLAVTETVFYFITYAYRKHHLQHPALHPSPLSKEQRSQRFHLCFDNSQDFATSFLRWFLDTPIDALKRENVKEWLRWAFLNTETADPNHDDELDTYVKHLEAKLGVDFEPGRANVQSIRLTLDRVDALHRSLTWYACVSVVDVLTHVYMCVHGFHFYRGSIAHSISIMPPRPQALTTTHRSPNRNMSYWYQPHTSQKELPIVFLHGIGVGLYPYMPLLKEVNMCRQNEDGKIGILAVEILAISSRITATAPRKEDMCNQLRSVLRYHGIERFVLVSHSYGSVISTHLLKTPDLARQISSVILVDPVSILLHQPDLVYNFTVRTPKFANEWLFWYFGSKDIGVAHTLSRTFFWAENILWKEDLFVHHATVFLSGKDSIINAPQVRRYLEDIEEHGADKGPDQDEAKGHEQSMPGLRKRGSLEVVWCADLDHGQVFDLAAWRERLKIEILRKARRV
ncbi:uncharacterized protein A1O9_07765 [Exophiala aquamarina CBS 119918]|uniref:AB hydrolase-1 domain-containing protein n=1 Tax=Exophiala aquamarina CBS 119918 TaxID=1182545 RepID=A0A072P7T5_9EURO|nr:uncharacterized protein A1O9_07765 [Exophiala aquamarina CBS 119918]KEF56184.1 hypothetical protein A1O9_07765 [Exophiala aquamarina CBS 119918]